MDSAQYPALRPRRKIGFIWSARLAFLLTAASLLLIAMSVLASRSQDSYSNGNAWLVHTEQVRNHVARVLQLVTDIESAARGYALSADKEFLAPFTAAMALLPAEISALKRLTIDNPTQQSLAARLDVVARQRAALSNQLVENATRNGLTESRVRTLTGAGRRSMGEVRDVVSQMQAEEARLFALRNASVQTGQRNAQRALWAGGALAIFLITFVAYATAKDGRRLRRIEEYLSITLRSIGDAVIATDVDGSIRFMNPVAEQLTGWDEKRARGRPLQEVFQILHEETRVAVESPVAKVLREGKIVGMANHTVLIAKDGSEHAIEDSGAPIFEMGELVGVVLVFRDATAQRAAEHALVQSDRRFRAAVDAVQGVLWTNTPTGEMRGEQPGWQALTGQQFADYQGFGWSAAVHPDDAQPTVDAWLQAVQERRLFSFEHRVRRHDGEWRNFSIRAIPLFDAQGAIREWVGVHTDITEQRQSEQALRSSEARFRAVQDAAIDGFMILESVRDDNHTIVDFRWIHANEAAGRLLGRDRSRTIGRLLLEEMPASRVKGLFDAYVRVVETGEAWTSEFEYDRAGVNVYFRLIAAKSGDGFAISFADLTDRRLAEEQVRERERQFVGLANALPQIVWTERPDGAHEYFNRGWYAYTGLTDLESKANDVWARVLHPDDHSRTAARWLHSQITGEPYEIEFRLRRRDGVYRWFLARAVADFDATQRIVQWFGTCTDIDETKKNEEQLRNTEIALREADQRKDEFLAILSHELRNPLAPIRNAAQLLESQDLSLENVARSRSIISRQVRHMASLLDDLLDMSRINRGSFALRKQFVSLQQLLEAALETARPLIDAKRHSVVTDWPSSSVEVEVDAVRTVQVLGNLLTNAAKYMDPEGQIFFNARIKDANLEVSVRDTGIGIAPDSISKVFEMFAQVSPNQERSEGGLGIGLALAKGLVELHGGEIQARSAGLHRGSEFLVRLPVLHRAADDSVATFQKFAPETNRPHARRILVVDDNQDGAESLAMLLRISGYEVTTAHTGPDALAAAELQRPRAVVLDIGLPGLSGYEVAQRIRREKWGTHVILIAQTGWGQDSDKRKAQLAGFDHHLTKPVDIEELEALLSSADLE